MAKIQLTGAAQTRIARINAFSAKFNDTDFTFTNYSILIGETRKFAKLGRTDRWNDAVKSARKTIDAALINGPQASGSNWQTVIREVSAMLVKAAI